ncbi:hypothetical protein SUGI_0379120 [Cryptomeria japonica]|nr:hypothetical protein SUGI_0379120 [Cryptomeria japonica]
MFPEPSESTMEKSISQDLNSLFKGSCFDARYKFRLHFPNVERETVEEGQQALCSLRGSNWPHCFLTDEEAIQFLPTPTSQSNCSISFHKFIFQYGFVDTNARERTTNEVSVSTLLELQVLVQVWSW